MVEEGEDQNAAGTYVNCLFRLRFGFRRALFVHLYLTNEPLVAFVRKLGIKGNADVARMMRVFLDVDVEGKHVIELDTFFDFFDVESSEYNKRAFRILTTFRGKDDQSGNGSSYETGRRSLTFDHFFVSMYDYGKLAGRTDGTLVQDALVRFVFDTMACGKGFCSRQDVRELVSLLHSDPGRVRQTTSSLVAIMDPHNRDMISFETFRKEKNRLGSMLFPAFNLQKTLRAKILGVSYWNRATRNRRKAGLIESDLHEEYMMLKDEHARNFHGSFADDAEMVGESEQSGGNVEGDNVDYSTEEGDVEEAGMSPGSDNTRRRRSSQTAASEQVSVKGPYRSDDGVRNPQRDSLSRVPGGGAKRRSSLTVASAQVAPGRHGSVFDDMQVLSPTSESSEDGRRSSVKTSRTTRKKSRKVSTTSASYDAE